MRSTRAAPASQQRQRPPIAFEIADNFDFNVGTKHADARRHAASTGPSYSNFDERNTGRHVDLSQHRRLQRRSPAAVLAAHRHARHHVLAVSGRLLLVRRVPRAPRLHAWRRRPQRDAVAHRRQVEPDAAPRLHAGRRSAASGRPFAAATGCSTTGTSRVSTTRRCASTASTVQDIRITCFGD